MADISFLEFYLLQHPPKMTTFLIAGTSAERLGKMQYLISSPLFVTFARAGLFLGPTISYSQEFAKVHSRWSPLLFISTVPDGLRTLGVLWPF